MKKLLIEIYDLGFETIVYQRYNPDRDCLEIRVKAYKINSDKRVCDFQTSPTYINNEDVSTPTIEVMVSEVTNQLLLNLKEHIEKNV